MGWVRSSAWIWVFSSTDRTTAPVGRVEVEPHDIADLGLERRIGAPLEGLGPMGLQTQLGPEPMDRRWGSSRRLGHVPHAPVGRALGWRSEGQRQEPVAVLATVRHRMPGPGPLGEAGETCLGLAASPELHGHERDAELVGDALVGQTLRARRTIEARKTARCSLVGARMTASSARRSGPVTGSGGAGGCAMVHTVADPAAIC